MESNGWLTPLELIERIAALVPPLWEDCDSQMGEGGDGEPEWDMAPQTAPDYEVDQRILVVDLPGRDLPRGR